MVSHITGQRNFSFPRLEKRSFGAMESSNRLDSQLRLPRQRFQGPGRRSTPTRPRRRPIQPLFAGEVEDLNMLSNYEIILSGKQTCNLWTLYMQQPCQSINSQNPGYITGTYAVLWGTRCSTSLLAFLHCAKNLPASFITYNICAFSCLKPQIKSTVPS